VIFFFRAEHARDQFCDRSREVTPKNQSHAESQDCNDAPLKAPSGFLLLVTTFPVHSFNALVTLFKHIFVAFSAYV
jgi:hypothetical protein